MYRTEKYLLIIVERNNLNKPNKTQAGTEGLGAWSPGQFGLNRILEQLLSILNYLQAHFIIVEGKQLKKKIP